MKYNEYKSMA